MSVRNKQTRCPQKTTGQTICKQTLGICEEEFDIINEPQNIHKQCNDKLSAIKTNSVYKLIIRHGK